MSSPANSISEPSGVPEAAKREALLDALSQAAHVGGWWLDKDSGSLSWTRETYIIHGLDPDENLDLSEAINFYAPEARETIKRAVGRCLNEGLPYEVELPLVDTAGRSKQVRAIGRPFISDGKIQAVYGSFQDITDQIRLRRELTERARQAETAHRARSSFLSAISHEFRTPMTGIIGAVDFAIDQVENESVKVSLSIALKCAQRLQFLLEDVLDYSALEAGREICAFEPVDLSPLLSDVMAALEQAGEATGQLRFLPEADVPERINADRRKLRRVLRHLIGNGFKYGSRPQVTVSVERRYWTGRDEYLFSTRSPGAPIPREQQTSIFEAFTQADMSSTREQDGAGMGLALSRATTEAMGGELGYNRIGDSMNEFWFSIPTKII